MRLLATTVRLLAGLFVDDGRLAVALLGVVAITALSAAANAPPAITGGTLVVGCLAALVWNVLSARRS